MKQHACVWLVALACAGALQGGTIPVPNGSFESPTTSFVNINIDNWQKSAKPDWYEEGGGFLWTQLTGLFANTAPGNSDHIDNCDGKQAIWLYAVPEVGLFQDYDSVDWNDSAPTHAFDAKFEPGKSYQLTVGVMGYSGGMLEGVPLELALYYRDAASNQVIVASTVVTNTLETFPTNTHLVDFSVQVPTVQSGDAWANRNIGIRFLSLVDADHEGGYWDLDNVRLSSAVEPSLLNPVWTNGEFRCTLHSEPGLTFAMLATTNLNLPVSEWTSLGMLTNVTGDLSFSDAAANINQRYYRAQWMP